MAITSNLEIIVIEKSINYEIAREESNNTITNPAIEESKIIQKSHVLKLSKI